jgi:uncharacterized metal-binding protein YceD (DUF177 family)
MKSEYVIGFSSLKDGRHDYHYKVDNSFFEQFEYTDIEGADLVLDVVLDKKPNMIVVEFAVSGYLRVMCDRCTDSFNFLIKGKENVIYKFTDEDLDDEKIISILPHEMEIDITIPVYEFATLLLPQRRIHPKGGCNKEMLNEIDNYLMVEGAAIPEEEDESSLEDENEIDPRWSKLKDLKNKS